MVIHISTHLKPLGTIRLPPILILLKDPLILNSNTLVILPHLNPLHKDSININRLNPITLHTIIPILEVVIDHLDRLITIILIGADTIKDHLDPISSNRTIITKTTEITKEVSTIEEITPLIEAITPTRIGIIITTINPDKMSNLKIKHLVLLNSPKLLNRIQKPPNHNSSISRRTTTRVLLTTSTLSSGQVLTHRST